MGPWNDLKRGEWNEPSPMSLPIIDEPCDRSGDDLRWFRTGRLPNPPTFIPELEAGHNKKIEKILSFFSSVVGYAPGPAGVAFPDPWSTRQYRPAATPWMTSGLRSAPGHSTVTLSTDPPTPRPTSTRGSDADR